MALTLLACRPSSRARRALLLAGAAISTAVTALCALAPSLEWLVALRFVQGFSVAAGIVIGRAIVSDVARGPVAERLFGILMTLTSTAPIVAPLVGATAIGAGGWRWVYWTLALVFLAMLLGVLFAVLESLPAERRHTGGAVATLRAMRLVLADRPYLGYTLAFTFTFGSLFCYIAASPFLLQNVLGLTVGQASIAFAAGGLIVTLSSALNPVRITQVRRDSIEVQLSGCAWKIDVQPWSCIQSRRRRGPPHE
ncbi:MFS transporter [Streptosporangium subroseum]|uniref:MFS transporter n=1 Tax=Streptosporangium subroseum TaxID=106412 RepID=UPI0034294351